MVRRPDAAPACSSRPAHAPPPAAMLTHTNLQALPPCAHPAASLGEVVVRLEIGSRDRASARRRPGLSGNPEDRPSPTARRRFAPGSLI